MIEIKIKVPLFVMLPKKTKKDKKVWLNLNVYRNLHYITENECKKQFYLDIKNSLPQEKITKFDVSCQIFKSLSKKGVKKKLDKSNVYSVLSKYFFDSLVENGNLNDDNDQIIQSETILPTKYLEYGSGEYAEFIIYKT
jgi:hypothetical protein